VKTFYRTRFSGTIMSATQRVHNTVVIIQQCCVCQTNFFYVDLCKANKMLDFISSADTHNTSRAVSYLWILWNDTEFSALFRSHGLEACFVSGTC